MLTTAIAPTPALAATLARMLDAEGYGACTLPTRRWRTVVTDAPAHVVCSLADLITGKVSK